MQKQLILILFLFLYCTLAKAQELIELKDGKKYPATPLLELVCDDYAYSQKIIVQVAKTPTGGILKLQVSVSSAQFFIADRVMLFLEDGKTIFCADKGLRENQDGIATSYYYFTPKEMELLRRSTIKNIRFKISGKSNTFDSKTGYFTADNKAAFLKILDKPVAPVDTTAPINALY